MKKIIALIMTAILLLPLLCACKSEEDCPDGACDVPGFDEAGNQIFSIVSPVGYHSVESITQAKRLDSLDGKRIALVGGSFMASITHAELAKCLKEAYPSAELFTFSQVGSAGPFSVFGQSTQCLAFQEKLRELKIDAVISGNCGCGLCTTKETGSSIAAEYVGIPSVTVGAPTFLEQIRSIGVSRGVPVLRCAEYPGAFAAHSHAQLRENTRKSVFPAVVRALTEPITQEEIDKLKSKGMRPYDETVFFGTYDQVQEYCEANGWTDGLPVVPPTDGLVREYLAFTPYGAEEVLGTFALAYRECLVYTVAVNAVMAGVPKEFMPICIALAQCMEDGEWRRPLASTHGWSPYAFLNGPLARQLGIDHAQGMISEETSKKLGRFLDLCMLNIGGYYVKENRMGSFGYLSAFAFAEDEETCLEIGWEPYHVSQGYQLNDNTVTAASLLQWGNNVTPATEDAEQIMKLLAFDITEKQQNGLGNTNPQVYRTVLITKEVAKNLAAFYPSKGALEDALIETARRPLYLRAYAHYWANTGSQQWDNRSLDEHFQTLLGDAEEGAAMTETPDWLRGIVEKDTLMTIATMKKGQTPLLVAGDGDRNKFQVMPGGGYVTVQIRLPENWNELVAPMGYEPLEGFWLEDGTEGGTTETKNNSPLPDGVWRMVPSENQLTEGGRIYRSREGALSFLSGGKLASVALSELSDQSSARLISLLSANCSFTLSSGRITSLTLRPSTSSRQSTVDLSGADAAFLNRLDLTVAVTAKQSKEEGGVTPSDTTLLLPNGLQGFTLDLGGNAKIREGADATFLQLDGARVTLSADAQAGSRAQILVPLSSGSYRMMTLAKTENALSLTYRISEGRG